MKNDFTRSEAAKRAGVNPETLRYYERRGLISDPRGRSGGYRRYSPGTVSRIRFIKRAQELGFSLDEILDLLALDDTPGSGCASVKGRAEAKIEEIEVKVRDLKRIRKALKGLVDQCPGRGRAEECPILNALKVEKNR